MPSITTQTIGPAAAAIVNSNAAAVAASRGATEVVSQAKVQEASKVEADRTSITATRDKDRSARVPKWTDGSFASQDSKPEQEIDTEANIPKKVNVTA